MTCTVENRHITIATVFIGVALVSTVFRVIGRLAEAVIDFRRW